MVAFCLFLLFVLCLCFLFLVDLFSFFVSSVPFAGYFLVRCLLSAFPAFLRTYSRFDLFGPVYLVTTTGFVADQLMWDKQQTTTTLPTWDIP